MKNIIVIIAFLFVFNLSGQVRGYDNPWIIGYGPNYPDSNGFKMDFIGDSISLIPQDRTANFLGGECFYGRFCRKSAILYKWHKCVSGQSRYNGQWKIPHQ